MTERTAHFIDDDTTNVVRIGAKVRMQRQALKLTLEEVARKSSLSTGFLSLVERDLSYPSLTTLSKIAAAIEMPADKLLSMPKGTGSVSKQSKRHLVDLNQNGVRYGRLSADIADSVMNAVEITLPPHFTSEITTHSCEEFVYVLSGRLLQLLDDTEDELFEGDCAHFQSIVPHRWINPTTSPTRLLWVGDLPIFPNQS
ncbi:MAG: XRE family transcriptional regulator [Litoreibacter sp.]